MKKGFIMLGIIILILNFASCRIPTSSIKRDIAFGGYKTYQWNDEISFPFPSPEAEFYEIMDHGGVHCMRVTRPELDGYLEILKNDGWETLDKNVQSIYYILIKDNMIINLVDQTASLDNHIRIEFTRGYMSTESDGRLGKKEAGGLIQKHIDSISNEK